MGIPIEDDMPASARLPSIHHPHTFDNDPGLKLKIQEFVGNHKEFRIETNLIHLRIIGNNNRVILKRNHGKLDVIGHATKVKVLSNSGKINYVGNNGKIYLGRGSAVTNVHYTGNQGSVKLLDSDFSNPLRPEHRSRSSDKINRLSSSSTSSDEKRQSLPAAEPSPTANTPPSVILINVKNNISLPNIDDLTKASEQTLNARTSFKISNSSTDICVNNFFRKRCT